MADSVQLEPSARRVRAALEHLGLWPEAASEQQALTRSVLQYVALLAKWNRTFNLTAVRDPDQMLVQHVFDSAAVVPALRERVEASRQARGAEASRPVIVDVGSGAGLPGIVLALLWREADFVLVEPAAKKAAFLQQVVSELALTNVTVLRARIEDLAGTLAAPDAVICRAFASLADYARAIERIAGAHTVVAAMKARPDEREESALTHDWRIAESLPLRVPELDAQRRLIVLERTQAKRLAPQEESHPRA